MQIIWANDVPRYLIEPEDTLTDVASISRFTVYEIIKLLKNAIEEAEKALPSISIESNATTNTK